MARHAAPAPPARPDPGVPAARPRFAGVDAARGIALIGMIAAHALLVSDDSGAPNGTYLVVGGRSAALFAVLAGVAIAFMTGRRRVATRPDRRAAAAVLGVRAVALLLIGLALGWTDSDVAAVILPFYAMLFLLAIPLVTLPTRALAGTALAVALVVPVLSQALRPLLPGPVGGNPSFGMAGDPAGLLVELLLTGTYPALPWAAYVAAGIAIGRLPLDRARTATRLLGGGAALAVGATAASALLLGPLGGLARIAATTPVGDRDAPGILDHVIISPSGTTPTTTWWWLTAAAPHSSTPLDLLATIGSSAAVLGAMLLVCRSAAATRALTPLAGAGAMTLTLYTASIVFMNSPADEFDPVPGFLLQVVAALVAGLLWRAAGRRGPLEAALSGVARAARDRARG